MKRAINFILTLTFVGLSFVAGEAFISGDHAKANKAATVALAAGLVVAVKPAGVALGFFESAGIAALKRSWHKMGYKTQAEANNLQALDYTIYYRKQITGLSGNYKILDETNSKSIGVSNFDKNKLQEGQNFAVEAISIREGNHATQTAPEKITNYTDVMSSVQSEVRSAEFVILLGSKEVFRIPLASMLVAALGTHGSAKDTAYHLKDNAFVIPENTPFFFVVEFPAVVAANSGSTNKFHMEVQLFGKMTSKKSE